MLFFCVLEDAGARQLASVIVRAGNENGAITRAIWHFNEAGFNGGYIAVEAIEPLIDQVVIESHVDGGYTS